MIEDRYIKYAIQQTGSLKSDANRVHSRVNDADANSCQYVEDAISRVFDQLTGLSEVELRSQADIAVALVKSVKEVRESSDAVVKMLEEALKMARDVADSAIMLEGDVEALVRDVEGA